MGFTHPGFGRVVVVTPGAFRTSPLFLGPAFLLCALLSAVTPWPKSVLRSTRQCVHKCLPCPKMTMTSISKLKMAPAFILCLCVLFCVFGVCVCACCTHHMGVLYIGPYCVPPVLPVYRCPVPALQCTSFCKLIAFLQVIIISAVSGDVLCMMLAT